MYKTMPGVAQKLFMYFHIGMSTELIFHLLPYLGPIMLYQGFSYSSELGARDH